MDKLMLDKTLQIRVSPYLYDKISFEALRSGLNISQYCRLRLLDREVITKEELDELKKEQKPKSRFKHLNNPSYQENA